MYFSFRTISGTNAIGEIPKLPTEYAGTGINTGYFGVLCLEGYKRMPGHIAGHSECLDVLEAGSIVIMVTIPIAIVLHMVHGAAVAFLEAFAEFPTILSVDRGAFEDIVIVRIGVTMINVVAACGYNTIAEALPLRVAVAVGCAIPVAITILVLVLILRGAGLWCVWFGFLCGGF